MRTLTTILLVLALAACSSGGGSTTTTAPPMTTTSTTSAPAATTLVFYVSNQSFDDDPIGIIVEIDDAIVVDQDFFVEGQHNWIEFDIPLAAGDHTIEAVSSTGASFTAEFEMPAEGTRWAVLDYWFHPDEGPRKFTFHIQDTQIGFA